jgi:hypothetical protein
MLAGAFGTGIGETLTLQTQVTSVKNDPVLRIRSFLCEISAGLQMEYGVIIIQIWYES